MVDEKGQVRSGRARVEGSRACYKHALYIYRSVGCVIYLRYKVAVAAAWTAALDRSLGRCQAGR